MLKMYSKQNDDDTLTLNITISYTLVCALAFLLGGMILIGCDVLHKQYIDRNNNAEIASKYNEVCNENILLNSQLESANKRIDDLEEQIEILNDRIEANNQFDEFLNEQKKILEEQKQNYSKSENVNIKVANVKVSERTSSNKVPESVHITGFTAEEFNELIEMIADHRDIENCVFSNTGETFVEVEETYGVNGLYLLAIFTNESGFGTNMIRPNNAGGLTKSGEYISFDSINDCILYLGNLLRIYEDKYNLNTFSEIGSRYCEGNSEWINANNDTYELYAEFAYKNIYV